MKKIYRILFCLFLLTSCNLGKNGIDVEIINSSEITINDAVFFTLGSTKLSFDKIEPNQKVIKFFDMTDIPKSDGSYILIFTDKNGEKKQMSDGYYTNGGSLNRKVIYEIKNDTVLVEFKDFFVF